MRYNRKYSLIGFGTFMILAVLTPLLLFSKPIIWAYFENGNVSVLPVFAVFNPLRETKSENESERVLNLLKNGECENVVLTLKYTEGYEALCEVESSNRVEDWKLAYRKDGENRVELFYRVKRFPNSEYNSNLGIDLEKKDNEWKVTDIGSIY